MAPSAPHPLWYESAVIYQVPVALYQDSDGNGWGDLRGLTSKLEHIHDLGATALWLQPFYRTPYVDGGYDVIGHREVSDRFGTLEDFEDLVARARDLDLEVIIDLVVQHTSVDHPWFARACRDRDSEYRDFYLWSDEPVEAPVDPVFPTVEESVWAWHEVAGQYYRHTFYSHEADLNLANPAVIEEIERTMEFWLDLGVAGFRVDAVPYIVVQAAEAEGHDDGLWLVEHFRDVVRRHREDGVLIAESDIEPDQYAEHFGDGDRFSLLLNFWLNNHLFLALARQEAEPIVRALEMLPTPPEGCSYATWLRNHDELDLERLTPAEREETMAVFAPHPQMRAFGRGIRRRLAPMLADPRQRKLAMFLLCCLPGTPVLLYGDEIGMGDDVALPDRAAVRTPMQWSNTENAGFSVCNPVELVHPVVSEGAFRYQDVNVESQLGQPDSLLCTLRDLFAVRRRLGPFLPGQCRAIQLDAPSVLAICHDTAAGTSLLLANLASRRTDVTLPQGLDGHWEEVAQDQAYEQSATDGPTHLHGFGYRWLHRSG